MPVLPLPSSSPAEQGVEAAAITASVRAWEASGAVRPFGLVVLRHGVRIAAAHWAPYTARDQVLRYSLSKTYTACAAGLAVAEGLIDLQAPVASYLGPVDGIGPRAASITVEHLLSMATGHGEDVLPQVDPDDLAGSFLRVEPDREPGSVFAYNNAATLMVGLAVARVAGTSLHEYLEPRLFEPLGITGWWSTVGGVDQGFSGLHTSVDGQARLGQLLLDRGRWQGREVLPEAWVDAMTTVHIGTDAETAADWQQGYGYQMWRSRHGWRGDGAFGQLVLVLPEQDLVVAVAAAADDMQAELDAVWDHLLPGVHDDPVHDDSQDDDPDGPAELDRLSLPVRTSTAPATPGRRVLRATGPAAADVAADGSLIVRDGELVLSDPAGALVVPFGDGHWVRGQTELADGTRVTTAGTAGWTAPGVLMADVLATSRPHVLHVRADVAAGTAELTWQTAPLWPTGLAGL